MNLIYRMGTVAAALVVAQAGYAAAPDDTGPMVQVPAPAPPAAPYPMPPVRMAPPAPPAPPVFGPAPQPAGAVITDPKARKAAKKLRRENESSCLSKSVSVVGRPIIPLFTQGERSTKAVRVTPKVGLSSCDALLAQAPDKDDAWDRRAVLLQARASHLIGLGGNDAALQSLDEADAIGKTRNDPLFDSSTGIGNGMLRAYVLGRQGKKDDAFAEIARLRPMRPYSSYIDRALDRIEYDIHRDLDRMFDTSASKLKWQPDMMRYLLPMYIWRGRLDSASRFADDVSNIDPKPVGGWTVSGQQSAAERFKDDIEIQMQRSYVWAGLGQVEKAQQITAGALADIPEFVGSKPVAEAGRTVSKSKMEEYEARVAAGAEAEQVVRNWEKAITLRASAAGKSGKEFLAEIEREGKTDTIADIDIVRQLKFPAEEEQAEVTTMLKSFDAKMVRDMMVLDVNALRDILPEAESLSDVPRFGGAGDGILFNRDNGFSQAKEKDSEIRTIRFGTTSGSGPMAEELSMLAVGEYAKREGKDSFILLSRRAIKRTTTVSGYYTGGYTYDSGYESQLRVILLDSQNLPPEWAGKRERLIMVAPLLAEIKPRYDSYEARKTAAKAKK